MGRDCKEREIEGKLVKGYMHCKKSRYVQIFQLYNSGKVQFEIGPP